MRERERERKRDKREKRSECGPLAGLYFILSVFNSSPLFLMVYFIF